MGPAKREGDATFWEHFAGLDPLGERAYEQMLVGVATRPAAVGQQRFRIDEAFVFMSLLSWGSGVTAGPRSNPRRYPRLAELGPDDRVK
jgi:hypothetical protein